MRLWTVHPRYLDRQGLTAVWREALLARAVLLGRTRGYRHHPQLERFRAHPAPARAISAYLAGVCDEASTRGYSFDRGKIGRLGSAASVTATSGQLAHEWRHLLDKLAVRSPDLHERWRRVEVPDCHPLFEIVPGGVEDWERRYDATTDRRPRRGRRETAGDRGA